MKKIYFFCIVAVIALFGLRVAKPELPLGATSEGQIERPLSLHDEIAEISKNLSDGYKPWLLGHANSHYTETDAHASALTTGLFTGFCAGVLTKILGAGASGIWPFIVAPLVGTAAWSLSLKLLYIFTPTGIYCTSFKIFHKVLIEMRSDPRAHGSFTSGDKDTTDKDVMSYVFTHFGDEKFPMVAAHAYFKSFHDRLLRAKILILQCLQRAEKESDLADAAVKLEKSVNKAIFIVENKMGLIITATNYLKQHESFHKDAAQKAAQREKSLKEAWERSEREQERQRLIQERANDRALAAQAGNVNYTSTYANK